MPMFHPETGDTGVTFRRQKLPTHLFYCRETPGHLRVQLTPDAEAAIVKFLGSSYKAFAHIADFYCSKMDKRVALM